jgi:predicted nucleotide-binding protein
MSPLINQKLIADLQRALNIKQAAVYRRVSALATKLVVSNDVAALGVAQDARLPINKYGTSEQLAALREARRGQPAMLPIVSERRLVDRSVSKKKVQAPSRNVFVVHGRNDAVRKSMFDFLRAIGLTPLEWATAMRATRNAAPYIGEVLEAAFRKATAVVVLLTPDDEAVLKKEFWSRHEDSYEKRPMGQARPNVLFEAGMAFGSHPRSTVLVEVGKCRPFSDTYGRHVVKLNNSATRRQELADKLKTAGCPVTLDGQGWLEAGNFE